MWKAADCSSDQRFRPLVPRWPLFALLLATSLVAPTASTQAKPSQSVPNTADGMPTEIDDSPAPRPVGPELRRCRSSHRAQPLAASHHPGVAYVFREYLLWLVRFFKPSSELGSSSYREED